MKKELGVEKINGMEKLPFPTYFFYIVCKCL